MERRRNAPRRVELGLPGAADGPFSHRLHKIRPGVPEPARPTVRSVTGCIRVVREYRSRRGPCRAGGALGVAVEAGV